MNTTLIATALVGVFFITFILSPVYGVAFFTAFRTLAVFAEVNTGTLKYSAEGFLTLAVIIGGLAFVIMNPRNLKGVLKWPFIIFILYCVLTVIGAEDIAQYNKKLARLIGYFFLYLMTVRLCREEKNIKILSYAFVVSLFVTNLPAVYMHFIAPAKYMNQIYGSDGGLNEVGLIGKNSFGFFSCYMIFFLIYLISSAKSLVPKVFFLALFVAQFALLVLSFTRSAWAAFVVAFMVLILYSKNRRRLIVPFLVIAIISATLSSVVYYGAYKDLTEKKKVGFSSWHFRTAYAWPASIKAFRQRPFMGWGLGNDLLALTKAAKLKNTSHNDYLLVLVETGAIGLSLYLLLLLALYHRTAKSISQAVDDDTRMLSVSTLAIFTAFLVGSVGEHLLQTPGATGSMITILGMSHGTLLAAQESRLLGAGEGVGSATGVTGRVAAAVPPHITVPDG